MRRVNPRSPRTGEPQTEAAAQRAERETLLAILREMLPAARANIKATGRRHPAWEAVREAGQAVMGVGDHHGPSSLLSGSERLERLRTLVRILSRRS